ncbi:MAG: hypothetical protein AAFX06_22465 [Planctomycetota bacterium]
MIRSSTLLTVVTLFLAWPSSNANAQFRGAIRPPAVRTVAPKPAVRPAPNSAIAPKPKPVTNKPTRAIQGNSLKSNKPQHLYGIFKTNTKSGKTSLHKFGISGGPTKSGAKIPTAIRKNKLAAGRDYSSRAISQVSKLNKQAAAKKAPVKYSTRVLKRIPSQPAGKSTSRQLVVAAEKQAVTKHAVNRGVSPKGNSRPSPAPFSPIRK